MVMVIAGLSAVMPPGLREDGSLSDDSLSLVITGLVPVIPLRWAQYVPKRDGRVKPGHDNL
jgi:hypothetical protein